MNEEQKKILTMLADGRLTPEEAEKLLEATSEETGSVPAVLQPGIPAFLYVKVISSENDNVDVKVPLSLIRAGMRFTSLIPKTARDQIDTSLAEQGISFDFNDLKKEDIETLLESLAEMEINVNSSNGDTVRVYCAV